MMHAEKSEDMINRVMTKDNIAMISILKINKADSSGKPSRLIVANAHMHWDPEFSDVKIVQTVMLVHEIYSLMKTIASEINCGKDRC